MSKPKNIVVKLIKKIFDEFVDQHSFFFLKPLMLVRIQDDVLHIVNFDLGAGGFTCDVAIQPLFVPEENLVLSFGNRISRLGVLLPERWSYGESESSSTEGLVQIKELLEQNALRWFENVGTPKGIVDYIEQGKASDSKYIVGFAPHLRFLYLGFCYMQLGKLEKACEALREMEQLLQRDERPWVNRLRQLGKEMSLLAEREPDRVNKKLEEFTSLTRKKVGIF